MADNKNSNEKISAIVLAAGKGTRMYTPLPKVLHPVAGLPMIHRVIRAIQGAGGSDVRVVVGFGQGLVRQVVSPMGVNCYEQSQQNGTADAVKAAQVDSLEGIVMIVNGDHPLIEAQDLKNYIQEFKSMKADVAVITAELKVPGEFGRIIRHYGELKAIVEAKDAPAETLKIREVNTGIYLVTAEALQSLLPQVKNNNSKKEFYLTDIISLGLDQDYIVKAIKGNPRVARGVNNQTELAKASRYVFRKKIKSLLDSGVVVIDPTQTYVEDDVQVGPATVLYPGAYLRGKTKVGSFCVMEPNTFVIDCEIGDSVQVRAGSYLEKSKIHSKVSLGPYARIRPDTEIMEEAHIGNFVELKKVKFGKGSKAGHLSYLGDAEIGEDVNVGCGTITCNYAVDKQKYKTKIGDRVFIGSDSQFVAPVEVGHDAIIASGSTVTEDVPAKALAIARGRQVNKENYVKIQPVENEKES